LYKLINKKTVALIKTYGIMNSSMKAIIRKIVLLKHYSLERLG